MDGISTLVGQQLYSSAEHQASVVTITAVSTPRPLVSGFCRHNHRGLVGLCVSKLEQASSSTSTTPVAHSTQFGSTTPVKNHKMSAQQLQQPASGDQLWFIVRESTTSSSFEQKVKALQEILEAGVTLKKFLESTNTTGDETEFLFFIHSHSMRTVKCRPR